MNQNQINRKHMMEITIGYLNENVPVWQSVSKIGEVKNALDGIVENIDVFAKNQSNASTTYGKTKESLKRSIAGKADVLNDLVEVYAIMSGDDELARSMSKSETALYRLKNDDFIREVETVVEKAVEHGEALKNEYGMTDEQVTDLQTDVDRFLEVSGLPRMYQVKSSVATQGLEELMTEASNLLHNKLDNLMKLYKRSNPGFYAGYEKARMVVGN
ncbi:MULTISPECIES: hypothetical protein [unclassified Saccharicrinis]|uniref:hypothetical protein n=1 Tax=unclassified Saccharicrinis TaxID=2646859 RepID=UPI003D351723